MTREAVRAYKDGSSFDPDVVAMLQNSLAEEDHAVSQSHMHAHVYIYQFAQYVPFFMHDHK